MCYIADKIEYNVCGEKEAIKRVRNRHKHSRTAHTQIDQNASSVNASEVFFLSLSLKTIHCHFRSSIHLWSMRVCARGYFILNIMAKQCESHACMWMHCMLNMCTKHIIIWQYDNITVVHCIANGNDDDGDATTDKLKYTPKTKKNTQEQRHPPLHSIFLKLLQKERNKNKIIKWNKTNEWEKHHLLQYNNTYSNCLLRILHTQHPAPQTRSEGVREVRGSQTGQSMSFNSIFIFDIIFSSFFWICCCYCCCWIHF